VNRARIDNCWPARNHLGQDEASLGRRHLAFGAPTSPRKGTGSIRINRCPVDQRAFTKMNFLNGARDAGADFDPLDRSAGGKLVHGTVARAR